MWSLPTASYYTTVLYFVQFYLMKYNNPLYIGIHTEFTKASVFVCLVYGKMKGDDDQDYNQ